MNTLANIEKLINANSHHQADMMISQTQSQGLDLKAPAKNDPLCVQAKTTATYE